MGLGWVGWDCLFDGLVYWGSLDGHHSFFCIYLKT